MSDKKGTTLWEKLMQKMGHGEPVALAPWKRICNPLDAQPGEFVTLDVLDYRGKNYQVDDITEMSITKDGSTQKIAQYTLECDDEKVWLLVVPARSGVKAIVLAHYDDFGADTEDGQAVTNIVEDPAGDFKVDVDEKNIHEQYWRVDGVHSSYIASTAKVSSADTSVEPVVGEVEYWDYWRKTQADSVDVVQYVYIVQDTSNGWIVIKRGEEIDTSRVTKY